MQYNVARDGQAVTVAIQGQLNFAANEEFNSLLHDLDRLENCKVVFDLSGLSHIDSVGLGLLYIAREELDRSGASLCLSGPRAGVKRLLELTEAESTFDIRP